MQPNLIADSLKETVHSVASEPGVTAAGSARSARTAGRNKPGGDVAGADVH